MKGNETEATKEKKSGEIDVYYKFILTNIPGQKNKYVVRKSLKPMTLKVERFYKLKLC